MGTRDFWLVEFAFVGLVQFSLLFLGFLGDSTELALLI